MMLIKGKNVLIVDNDAVTRLIHRIAVDSLSEFQTISTEACSGSGALELIVSRYAIDRRLPDLILLGINMPIMDGFAFMERLKALDFLKYIRIVIVTASNDYLDKIRSSGLGVKYFFTKPLSSALLKDAILEIIEQIDDEKED